MNNNVVNDIPAKLRFLEALENHFSLRQTITVTGARFRLTVLKYLPALMAVSITSLLIWAMLSGGTSIGLSITFGLVFGAVGYGLGWFVIWLLKKSYMNPMYTELPSNTADTPVYRLNTNNNTRTIWVLTGIGSVYVVTRSLFFYRGLAGLLSALIFYLPSLTVYVWVMIKGMEGNPVIPSRILYRTGIVIAVFLTHIFMLWWLLETGNQLGGGLGIGIVSLLFLFMELNMFFHARKRKRTEQPSPLSDNKNAPI